MRRSLGIFFLLFTLAFVVGGVGMAMDQPAIAIPGFIGLVLAAVISIILASARTRSGNSRLVGMQGVRHGRATILQAEATRMLVSMGESKYPPRTYRLRLRVELEGRQPYELTHYEAAYPWDAGHLRAGHVMPCLVHPTKDSEVYLDFERRAPATTTATHPRMFADVESAPTVIAPSGLDSIPWPSAPSAPVQYPGGQIDIDDLLRQKTGSDLQGLLRRVEAGEQVPGVSVGGLGMTGAPGAPGSGGPGIPASYGGAVDATAVINGVRELGPDANGHPLIELDLLVAIPGQTPYRTVQITERPVLRMPSPGETLRVRVDPSRPSEIALLD